MKEIKSKDLRVSKSRQAIEEALLQLIDEKGFNNVHINDIALRAKVNRNTIYLHYESKENIIEQIVERTFQEQYDLVNMQEVLKSRFSKRKTTKTIVGILTIINQQIELYRILLTEPSLSGYLDKVINSVRVAMLGETKRTKKNEIAIEFILSGIYGVIQRWIVYAFGTIEENAEALSNLIFVSYRYLSFN